MVLYSELMHGTQTERWGVDRDTGRRGARGREIPQNVTVVNSRHWHHKWFVFSLLRFYNLVNLMSAYFLLIRRKLRLLKDHVDGYLSVKITRREQRINAKSIKRVIFLLNVQELEREEGSFCDSSRSWLSGWHSWWWNQQRGRKMSKRDKWES